MTEVVILLKNDYAEEELCKIIDKVNNRIRRRTPNIYDILILKTTDKAVYHKNKDELMKVPDEYIKAHLSVEGLETYKEQSEVYRRMDDDEIRRFTHSDRAQKFYAEYTDITIKYYAENGNSVDRKIEPNKYVLSAKLYSSEMNILEDILKKCKIDIDEIIVCEHATFGSKAFERISPKKSISFF